MDFPHDSAHPVSSLPPIDFQAELNEDQYAAVTAEFGPALVLAGAGSGKTRTLTYRVAYLLQQGMRPGEILLLTFTNKAAREMLHRVEDLTGVPAHRFWGGTFHHIGQKILRIHGELIGLGRNYTILDAGDAEALMSDTVKEVDGGFFRDKANPKAKVLGEMYSMARNTRLSPPAAIARYYPHLVSVTDQAARFFAAYQKRKLEQQVVDYDDLLEYLLLLLQDHEEVRTYYQHRFSYLLVDEYQDTNVLQAQIVDLIGAHHRVMAVGDDAQCIYSWRGADFTNILTFPDRHPGTKIYKIEINYRSTPEILDFANGILLSQEPGAGFKKELRAARSSSLRPFIVPAMDGREQADFIIKRLSGLLDQGYNLSDVAILYRAHYQSLDVQMELSRQGIPFQITSGIRFFEQAHIRDLVAQLRFAYNPKDLISFQRVAALLPKVGPKTAIKLHGLATDLAAKKKVSIIEGLLEESVKKKVPAAAIEEWPSLIWSLRDMAEGIRDRSPAEVVQIGMDSWYGDYLRGAYNNYPSRLDDLKSLVGFADRFEEMQDLLAQLVLLNAETTDRSVDTEEHRIRLTTVHQAKGLEFPIVFIVGLGDGLFPLRRAIEAGELEEERRLFYVAVTRAKDELYLCYPRIATNGPPVGLKPSRFLQEIPDHLYEMLRLQGRRW
jgi:DNA helicase II / ATP-dependent DNA helicase PcrA